MNHLTVLDLFSGAGGFSLGSHAFTDDVWGIELDADAVATQAAAGMKCEQSDITTLDPDDYADSSSYRPWMGDLLHIHASPPCQSFSIAGKGEGRNHLDALGRAAVQILLHGEHTVDLSDVPKGSLLVLEPAMWIHVLRPDSISMEQVRSVLPIWESYEVGLYGLGYQTWTGVLHSEQYGVPQARTRAWLGASLHRPVEAPAPTHSRYHPRNPEKLDAGLRPWVSMSEALGWGMTKRGSYTVTAGGTSTGDAEIFPKTSREAMDAASERGDWTGTAARRVTVAEAAVLQGFPADFPFQGSKTSQFRQVGNAVNPAIAEVVLRSVL